jgi:hypothetical protein
MWGLHIACGDSSNISYCNRFLTSCFSTIYKFAYHDCIEKLNGKPLFSTIDKMKICWCGHWAKASTPTGGPEGVCELEASRQCQAFLRDVGTMMAVPSSIDADVAV